NRRGTPMIGDPRLVREIPSATLLRLAAQWVGFGGADILVCRGFAVSPGRQECLPHHARGKPLLLALTIVLGWCSVGAAATAAKAPLADAAEKADWPRVRALLKEGADVHAAQVDGM